MRNQFKKLFIAVVLVFIGTLSGYAQKYALIDMEYITKNIPEYQSAMNQLESDSKKYQSEVEALGKQAKNLYEQYQKDASKLSQSQRTIRETAIVDKEKSAQELRNTYFGPKGELALKRERLIGPLQQKIYNAVKLIAERNGYTMVIDRSSAQSVIFASPSIDVSDTVLKQMGYTPSQR